MSESRGSVRIPGVWFRAQVLDLGPRSSGPDVLRPRAWFEAQMLSSGPGQLGPSLVEEGTTAYCSIFVKIKKLSSDYGPFTTNYLERRAKANPTQQINRQKLTVNFFLQV